ncbi:hypothetical protein L1887_49501 [Cichorium endivia]|nr:hypothetical protein L1887_49501 [Cichorium endivia]
MSSARTRLLKLAMPSSDTRRNAVEVRSPELAWDERPDAVASHIDVLLAQLGQDAHLEAEHREEQVRIVLAVHGAERVLPFDGGERARQAVLDRPEHGAAEVDVVFDEAHARVARPALAVVVADHVAVVRIRVGGEVSLDEVARLVGGEAVEDVDAVDVARVEAHRVSCLGGGIAELEEAVGHVGRTCHLVGALQAEDEQIKHETVVLEYERAELQAADQAVRVDVRHVLEHDGNVVLGGDVVGQIVVHDESQQAIEQREVDLFKHLAERRLHEHVALALGSVPDVVRVVDAVAPLVHQQRRRLRVAGLDPCREELALVGLVREVLAEIGVGDLLDGLDVVGGRELGEGVEEVEASLLECALREHESLDARERLVRIVERLLDERELLALALVQTALDRVGLLERVERQHEVLDVVLVVEARERDGAEPARLEPLHGGCEGGDADLGGDVGTALEVVCLPLLLCTQEETRQPALVLAHGGLVHGRTTGDPGTLLVSHGCPPVELLLDVPQDEVLDGRRQIRAPRRVAAARAPGLLEVTHDGLDLVLTHALGHGIEDVVHHGGTQLEVHGGLDALLGDGLRAAAASSALELACEQIAEPALEQRHDTAQEEDPHPPRGRPEADAGTLADACGVEAVVDDVLEVLAGADLAHGAVLVPVDARERGDVVEEVLEAVCELEGVDGAEAELDVCVDDELHDAAELADEVEGVSETALLALLGGEGLCGLEVHVVVEVEVRCALAVDEQIHHVE